MPVLGLQLFLVQAESAAVGHETTVAGFTLQSPLALSQYRTPLHRLPSSCLSQSALCEHLHRSVGPAHLPASHTSPCVHGSPSSHGAPLAAGFCAHSPVYSSQAVSRHAVSLVVSQATAVPVLCRQVYGKWARSQ